MSAPRPGFAPDAVKRWIPVAVIGVVAITAGIVLPQVFAVTDSLRQIYACL